MATISGSFGEGWERLPAMRLHARRHADRDHARRHVVEHDGIGSDEHVVPDRDLPEHLRARADLDARSDPGRSLRRVADRHAVEDLAVLPDLLGQDHAAEAVVDEEPRPDALRIDVQERHRPVYGSENPGGTTNP